MSDAPNRSPTGVPTMATRTATRRTTKEADKTLEDLFHDQLKDAFSAESQITKALPKMAKAAHSPELREGFEMHLNETKNQVERLRQVCEQVGIKTGPKTCEAMEGLIEEGKAITEIGLEPDA